MNQRNASLIQHFYRDMWNQFDTSIIPDLFVGDLRFRGSLGQDRYGYAELREYVEFVQRAFPDFHNHIEDMVSEGDRSFVRLTYSGTHQGELFGIPATGKRIEYSGAALFSFRGDRIATVWVLGDMYSLLQQLGGVA